MATQYEKVDLGRGWTEEKINSRMSVITHDTLGVFVVDTLNETATQVLNLPGRRYVVRGANIPDDVSHYLKERFK